MINREATIRWKGYDPDMLKPWSKRRVWCVCDVCRRGKWVRFDGNVDVCRDCVCKSIGKHRKLSGSCAGVNNPNYGKKASAETRRKMSVARKGQKRTREQKNHISEALTVLGAQGAAQASHFQCGDSPPPPLQTCKMLI